MDYTQNYHLPQWEKSDRVLMEDFNQMCERIDSGISANKTAADALAGQIAQVDRNAASRDSANAANAQTALKTGLFRAAYNQYHAATARDPMPRQNGIFYQKLLAERAAQTGFSGFSARNQDAIWTAKAANQITHKPLSSGVQLVQQMSITSDLSTCQPLIVDFTLTEIGFFTVMSLAGSAANITATSVKWLVTWENLDTQRIEYQFEETISLDKNNSSNNIYKGLHTRISFLPARYRLTVMPLDNPYTGRYTSNNFYITTLNDSGASFQQTVSMEESGSDALLSLVCQENGASFRLTWDGRTVAPFRTHSYTDAQGRAVKELEFRKGSSIGTSSTVKLEVSCQSGQYAVLYDWGVAAI